MLIKMLKFMKKIICNSHQNNLTFSIVLIVQAATTEKEQIVHTVLKPNQF